MAEMNGSKRRELKRPPAMGELKRAADAEAPILRAQLRTLMRLDGLTTEDVAQRSGLDAAALSAFLDGASLNPRWQDRLARWLDKSIERPD
jgi:hypothetical protein